MNKQQPQPIIFDRNPDGSIHLSFGHFETKSYYTEGEIQRGYNIFGQPLDIRSGSWRYYRVLRMGDGIKVVKSYAEALELLGAMFPSEHTVNTNFVAFGINDLNVIFEVDSPARKPLSEQA